MFLETVRYMRNQLLRDTDWVSMAHSLEIRVPLVDSQLTTVIAGLAAQGRIDKSDLPETLAHPLPEPIRKRPKTGFTTPTWKWLRHHPGLDAWHSIPFLAQSHVRDPRRWVYTLLRRVPEMHAFLK
jgi:asparagine synthase (glutamine-hydrolysing)